jgi:hypothetical protein
MTHQIANLDDDIQSKKEKLQTLNGELTQLRDRKAALIAYLPTVQADGVLNDAELELVIKANTPTTQQVGDIHTWAKREIGEWRATAKQLNTQYNADLSDDEYSSYKYAFASKDVNGRYDPSPLDISEMSTPDIYKQLHEQVAIGRDDYDVITAPDKALLFKETDEMTWARSMMNLVDKYVEREKNRATNITIPPLGHSGDVVVVIK